MIQIRDMTTGGSQILLRVFIGFPCTVQNIRHSHSSISYIHQMGREGKWEGMEGGIGRKGLGASS